MKNINRYLPIILVIAGQLILLSSVIFKDIMVVGLFGMVLSGIGAGLWAKRTGRSAFAWFSLATFVPLLGSVIILVAMLMQRQKNVDPQRPVKMYVHALIAFTMFFTAAIAFNSLALAVICFVGAIIGVATRTEGRYTGKIKMIAIGIYVFLFAMVFVTKGINNNLSYKNAKVIIAACEQYKNKTGVYPDKLEDLVPGYLAEIPQPRYVFSEEFRYYHDKGLSKEDEYQLMFVIESPFGRRIYGSKSKKWHGLD